jgi:hypothetical protein
LIVPGVTGDQLLTIRQLRLEGRVPNNPRLVLRRSSGRDCDLLDIQVDTEMGGDRFCGPAHDGRAGQRVVDVNGPARKAAVEHQPGCNRTIGASAEGDHGRTLEEIRRDGTHPFGEFG